ncbi:MAG: Asp-tRNA(Asn)/Glu-tRNA(Gln) amidotransferase GatCAB subunit B, partial [Patescibacteria group bacterium]|nr:Asp-tRNA(Asn)/Glu-tRNA(Gln) amidotransferase GatCAB subunit B [Patescibacteria group bacterium]
IDAFPVSAADLASLLKVVAAGELTTSRGREVLAEMVEHGGSVEQAMDRLGIVKVDDSALEALCRQLLEANPKVVQQVKEGKQKAVGSLIGQAKKSNPNVDPGQVQQVCLTLIAGM